MKKDKLKHESNNANVLLCADNFTGYFDDTNKPIFVGDKLKSEWNYEVIVVKDGVEYSGEGSAKLSVKASFAELKDENLPFEKSTFASAVKNALEVSISKM